MSGISRSLDSGKTFIRFRVDPDADGLIEDLNYASTQGAIKSVTQLKEIGARVLEELKKNFPERKAGGLAAVRSARGYRQIKPKSLRLKDGWNVTFYDAGMGATSSSLLGFYVSHRQANSNRIRTILASLESGSRPYTIRPVKKKSLRFPNGYPNATDQAFAMHADIPAREGFGYLRKTEMFADQLLASKTSEMEQTLLRIIEKGERFKERQLTAASIGRDIPENIEEAIETFSSSLKKARNPLKQLRSTKRKLRSRRFTKGFK